MRSSLSTMSKVIENKIQEKLILKFEPVFLQIFNESDNHAGPPNRESHFKVVLVSDKFTEVPLLQRHRLVNETLSEEIKLIHALSLQLKTAEQWKKSGGEIRTSPPCLGGGASEKKF